MGTTLIGRPAAAPAAVAARPGGRLAGADLLRAVAMVSVIAVHAVAWMATPDAPAVAFYGTLDRLLRFGVPVFVFLTGYVLVHRYRDRGIDRRRFTRGRARRVIVPFISWAVIYLACAAVFTPLRDQVHSVADLGGMLWSGTVAGHLYFLPVALQFYLLFALLPRSRRAVAMLCAVAIPLQLALTGLRATGRLPEAGILGDLDGEHAQWLFVWWLGYYALGAAAAAWREPIELALRRHRGLALAAPMLAAPPVLLDLVQSGAQGYDEILRPSIMLLTVTVLAAGLAAGQGLARGRRRRAQLVEMLAQRSLGVYLLHPLLLTVVGRTLQLDGSPLRMDGDLAHSIVAYLLLVGGTLAASLAAVGVLCRVPGGWLLAGRTEGRGARREAGRARPLPRGALPVPIATESAVTALLRSR
ncbi:MAG TPA: acyltransferase [Candidatus Dormibacteraeota bacterium]|nr:acyltransferase [Candidatus Dormibacteraeota bacterium]